MHRLYTTPEQTLSIGPSYIQQELDYLTPEPQWPGGFSRLPQATWGHDTKIANILITSQHIRSNLLHKFDHSLREEYQRIIGNLLEILYHLPCSNLEENAISLIPKTRDMGRISGRVAGRY
ncbi:hypothetical protein F4779DRAFT_558778 [Xylariaceae sp. FL0662B]|nr:hypothetical protein F4779DRAFT_558778 [Xylariaceae sp. FL0662B]